MACRLFSGGNHLILHQIKSIASVQRAAHGLAHANGARGLPVGGDIEYADQSTLLRALDGRQAMD